MQNANLGFKNDLFVLPFDHRGSFQEKLFGIKGRIPTESETAEIASYKDIIYEGFKKSLKQGLPVEKCGILVDEQFGSSILKDAKSHGYTTACPAEKSGQDEFDFEYGPEFGAHINKFNPTLVKVLVRLNPEADKILNERQLARLKQLSHYCQEHGRKFMFELLVPATPQQLKTVDSNQARFDSELRPSLMISAMKQIQDFGVEPDVWKLEGVETRSDVERLAAQARNSAHRKNVGVILLGRGENAEKVRHWLKVAASVDGLVGFAVGRTVFWEPLKAVKEGRMDRDTASSKIAETYKGFCDLWMEARA